MYTYLLLVCCMHLLFKGKNHVLVAVELFLFLWDDVSWTLHVLKTKIKPSKLIEFFKSMYSENFQIFLSNSLMNMIPSIMNTVSFN